MDEQLIMKRTGHRSTDGVRAYKRSSLEQQALVSRVLTGQTDTQSHSPPLGGEGKEIRLELQDYDGSTGSGTRHHTLQATLSGHQLPPTASSLYWVCVVDMYSLPG